MDGSASAEGNSAPRQSAKRRHSAMAESHTGSSPADLAGSEPPDSRHDSHYDNEHPSRRPRLDPAATLPFGYGFDLRRPIFTSTEQHRRRRSPTLFEMNDHLETIDLTRETLALPRISQLPTANPPSPSQHLSQRTAALPRFSRDDIIDISSGDEEEDTPPQSRSRTRTARHILDFSDIFDDADSGQSHGDTDLYTLTDQDYLLSDLNSGMPTPPPALPPAASESAAAAYRPPSMFEARRSTDDRTLRSHRLSVPRNAHIVDLTTDDDVEFLESRPANIDEPRFSRGVQTQPIDSNIVGLTVERLSRAFYAGLDHTSRLLPRITAHVEQQARRHRTARSRYPERRFDGSLTAAENVLPNGVPIIASGAFTSNLPGLMNYTLTAFDLGQPAERRDRAPVYEAPPPLPDGFTGSPTVDEPVVCPNCGDELAQGSTELKRQVWVIKACGHAYCGGCVGAKLQQPSRPRPSKRDKDREPTNGAAPLLRTCVIEGCGKGVSKSTVLHVYLSE